MPSVDAAATFIPGSSQYQAVAPARLADTRAEEGAFGFTRISDQRRARPGCRPVRGARQRIRRRAQRHRGQHDRSRLRHGVSRRYAHLPTASNVNFDRAGQVMANMVTVKLGAGGAVDVYMQAADGLAVDVSGAYVPVSSPAVASGRLVTRADGAFRVLDTRDRGFGVGAGARRARRCQLPPAFPPMPWPSWSTSRRPRPASGSGRRSRSASAAAERQQPQHRHTRPDSRRSGDRAACRARRRSTCSPKAAAISSSTSPASSPARRPHLRPTGCSCRPTPTRLLDSRDMFVMPTWGGSTLEFPVYGPDKPGLGGRRQHHGHRLADRRLRHSVSRPASPDRRPPTSTSTRGIRRSPTMRSSGQHARHQPVHACRVCT